MRDLAFYVDGLVEGRRGTLVQRQKDRSVWRVEEKGEVWFAKRGVTPKRRREIRRESENARAVSEAAYGADVLASGAHGGAEWIVTKGAELTVLERMWITGDRAILGEAARVIRSMHERGWATPDLKVEHVLVQGDRVVFIDLARLERGRRVSRATKARDLATLVWSLGISRMDCRVWRVHVTERVRMLREATGLEGDALRQLLRGIERELLRYADRTRWRHQYFQLGSELQAVLERSSVFRRPEEVFDALLSGKSWAVVRRLPDRENRRIGDEPGGTPLFFAKVFPATKKGWSPAMREVAAIDLFQRAGILVNRLAAYAEDVDKGSMVAVKAARGEPLDDLLRRGVSVSERRALAVQTARIWRRMRECGLRHRDAYPCHLFVAPWEREALRFELRFIDMTRAGRVPFPKERWFVKDAAALWHGLPKPPVTRTDAVRWLREYFRIGRLDARAKRFARRVAAKERRIAARQARKAKR